jgi:hypothetical protein
MSEKNILMICGSLNQTTMMHQIGINLTDHNVLYSPYFTDGLLKYAVKRNLLDFTVLGGQSRRATETFLYEHQLPIDFGGQCFDYDLILTCSDLIIPFSIRNKKIILIQEGMTDPESFMYYLVKYLRLPAYLASTATTGLSDAYDIFCVASSGYRELFIKKGVNPDKLRVTGIPNFDNIKISLKNDFPYKDYVLVATSDTRETFKFDNRNRFYRNVAEIAGDRQLIFKLHPNEKFERSAKEIKTKFPEALIYQHGNTAQMIANCAELITQYSSVVYIGLALNKKVHSYFDIKELKKLLPVQNNGTSARTIAGICQQVLDSKKNMPFLSLPGYSYIHSKRVVTA